MEEKKSLVVGVVGDVHDEKPLTRLCYSRRATAQHPQHKLLTNFPVTRHVFTSFKHLSRHESFMMEILLYVELCGLFKAGAHPNYQVALYVGRLTAGCVHLHVQLLTR